jgi:hypothetical protein
MYVLTVLPSCALPSERRMNYDAVVAKALSSIPAVRDFRKLFPNADHTIVKAKRDFFPDGWKVVYEWVSRGHLHQRYVVWLVVAIDITADDTIVELEKPQVSVAEVEKLERSAQKGPTWELGWAELEEGIWERLIENGGDFAALDLELTTDAPVDGFLTFWQDTKPIPLAEPPEGMAIKAPLRFMMQSR